MYATQLHTVSLYATLVFVFLKSCVRFSVGLLTQVNSTHLVMLSVIKFCVTDTYKLSVFYIFIVIFWHSFPSAMWYIILICLFMSWMSTGTVIWDLFLLAFGVRYILIVVWLLLLEFLANWLLLVLCCYTHMGDFTYISINVIIN